ncbi:MAG: helix-turn-helix transcriptional regulator [Oscillochloris sp.]|nr:helix-turn-helix transcriptional regulator [Oscillochloris sp.]
MARSNSADANIPLAVLVFRTAMEKRKSISEYAGEIDVGAISLRQFVHYKTQRPRTRTLELIGAALKLPLEEVRRRMELPPAGMPPFGEWLAAQMEGRYSRSALSKATGISDSALKNYITGKTLPEPNQARKIADVLDLDLTEMSAVIIANYVAQSGGEFADDDEELEEEDVSDVAVGTSAAALPPVPPVAPPVAAPPASNEEDRLIGLWRSLHPQGRRAAMLYMAGLLTEG